MLFDMDGTLFDSEPLWDIAIEELAHAYGSAISVEARLAMVGRSVDESMVLFHDSIGQPWREAAASARWITDRVTGLFATDLVWRPGARELLHEVRAAGLPTALVTSTSRQCVDVALDTLGRHNFDAVVCGDEVAFTKPHPDPYQRAAKLLGVDPTDCIAIEDSPTGVASALAAGARVIGIPHAVKLSPMTGLTLLTTLTGATLATLTTAAFPH
ncbi:HAD family hydrolase [Catellatospora bangladeshensis]|uniref:Haloacid dehalogenase n=1 Tax=Catellatospora bangladeshensis TaxID=310355 RepID=A0A8J3JUF5_9ACTN|nr:HAD family phosphatase [Catellatospora bangladeshensis]GIF85248.1 haloacid dehalogenase [Catellatospora bangladeshensis]